MCYFSQFFACLHRSLLNFILNAHCIFRLLLFYIFASFLLQFCYFDPFFFSWYQIEIDYFWLVFLHRRVEMFYDWSFFSASRSFCVQNSVLISFFSLFPLKYFFVAAVYSFFLLSICKLRDAFIARNFIWPVLFCKVLVCSIFGLIIKRITLFFKNSPTQF